MLSFADAAALEVCAESALSSRLMGAATAGAAAAEAAGGCVCADTVTECVGEAAAVGSEDKPAFAFAFALEFGRWWKLNRSDVSATSTFGDSGG